MTPATGTEAAEAETHDEWRKRRSAELRQQMREGWEPRSGEPVLQRLQAEEAAWWGFEQGIEEQREVLAALIKLIEDGTLVRDISRDAEDGWAFRQVPLVKAVSDARALLDRTEAQG
jgi:succinate dehydrogenase/fumarate reductase flavoprotein subunit